MRWFLVFVAGSVFVAGLTLIDHDIARWIVLGLLAVVYVGAVVHRRYVQPSHTRRTSRVRGAGSSF